MEEGELNTIPMAHLSKSDFKAARECPAKLYYKKKKYPSAKDTNEFLGMLADGGFVVEQLAKLLYPDAIEMKYEGANADAAKATMEALKQENVTLLEATLLTDRLLARADILIKRGNSFDLIEVKSKSYDSRSPESLRDVVGSSKWQPYVEDVAFQAHVLRELFPGAEIRSFLLVPDKGKSCTIDALHQLFDLRREMRANGYEKVTVDFTGSAEDASRIAGGDHFLALLEVSPEEREMRDAIAGEAGRFASSLVPTIQKIPGEIGTHCNDCEYRAIGPDGLSGFLECWGPDAAVTPHLLDLFSVGSNGEARNHATELIAAKRYGLFDVDEKRLVKKDGTVGTNNARQLVQIRHTRAGTEWIGKDLGPKMAVHGYPLHFIDFEASNLAVPYHAGMRPYERVAFQWSLHTIPAAGAEPVHAEWINTDSYFPNFAFARSLREALGDGGTVFMWSHYERDTLNMIREQILGRAEDDPELGAWLLALAKRLVDMCKLCSEEYFHPRMGKYTSIKKVLDAVWHADPVLKAEFPGYAASPDNPYETLPPAVIAGEEVVVSEGTGAVRAYQAMLYGPLRHDAAAKRHHHDLLLRYCKLDTAAMVMIWNHWRRVTVNSGPSATR